MTAFGKLIGPVPAARLPVRAYRFWRVDPPYRLLSPYRHPDFAWLPGAPAVAHRAPEPGNEYGIHAYRDPGRALEDLEGCVRFYGYDGIYVVPLITGTVELSGPVLEYDFGYRAGVARLVDFAFVSAPRRVDGPLLRALYVDRVVPKNARVTEIVDPEGARLGVCSVDPANLAHAPEDYYALPEFGATPLTTPYVSTGRAPYVHLVRRVIPRDDGRVAFVKEPEVPLSVFPDFLPLPPSDPPPPLVPESDPLCWKV